MVSKGDRVVVLKKGNLHEGEKGIVARIGNPKGSYPVEVQFPDNSRSYYKHSELRKV